MSKHHKKNKKFQSNKKSNSSFGGNRNKPSGRLSDIVKDHGTASAPIGCQLLGAVKRHPDGYGFFIAEEAGVADVYVPKNLMDGVMSNDKVTVTIRREGDRFRADTLKVTERKTKTVTGQIKLVNTSQGVLKDDSFGWGEDLKVTWPPTIKVKDKEWVVAKITTYPDHVRGFQGQVETIIGDISDPMNDNVRIMAAHNIPREFSSQTQHERKSLPTQVTEAEIRAEGRKDLRNKKFITIDGKTAKDFDDAVYTEKIAGGFRLWVAIADVSHYVRPGSAINRDAYDRGTSVYFPNFVEPMLPEELSNELCSLKPNVPRLALVAEMDFNFQGVRQKSSFYEATILSHARVTYGEAQEVLDGPVPAKFADVQGNIKLCGELAHVLMDKRFREGSLNLEIPESTIELSDSGVPLDIIRSERIFAHRLIEELMLAANVAVADFFIQKNVPAIYRIHEPPKTEALETLERFLDAFGYQLKIGDKSQITKRITQALKEFDGKPQETVVNILTLRSMNQARYSPENAGHFGLGFKNYTHFTSPIRRYPDLIVHRLIKATLGIKGYQKIAFEELNDAGTFLSACEQRSVKAERQISAIKKARFLQKHLGEEFEGTISSVAKFGLFVTLRQYDVDGLIRVETLGGNAGGDHFEFDEENLALYGRRSGFRYTIGDPIKIQVVAADHQNGRVDFDIVTGEDKSDAKKVAKEPNSKRRPVENDREHVREVRVSGRSRKDRSEKVQPGRKAHPSRRQR